VTEDFTVCLERRGASIAVEYRNRFKPAQPAAPEWLCTAYLKLFNSFKASSIQYAFGFWFRFSFNSCISSLVSVNQSNTVKKLTVFIVFLR